jgi:hypothetical protein
MKGDTPTRTFGFFKWLLFAVEIFLLWVLCNTLFLVPGPYKGERGVIIIVTALPAAVVAWGVEGCLAPRILSLRWGKRYRRLPLLSASSF